MTQQQSAPDRLRGEAVPDHDAPAVLEARGLAMTYGSGPTAVEAIRDVSFSIRPGEFVCVVGPSGCGKTTLLKSIAGLLRPTHGTALIQGRVVDGPPQRRASVESASREAR